MHERDDSADAAEVLQRLAQVDRVRFVEDAQGELVRGAGLLGENICEPDVLRKAADAAGLDGTLLAGAVDDPEIRAEGVDCLVRAYDDDVFGIPYGTVGRNRFWGLDRVDGFLQALEATVETEPDPVPVARSYDWDTAGGCG